MAKPKLTLKTTKGTIVFRHDTR